VPARSIPRRTGAIPASPWALAAEFASDWYTAPRESLPAGFRRALGEDQRGTPLALSERMDKQSNPWKWSLIAAVIGVPLTVLAFAGGARLLQSEPEAEARSSGGAVARPAPRVIEDCNQYAAAARDNMRIVKDGAIGGAVGAGVGAAGGAIADGGSGAGKGAGIGAVVGVVGGALYGLNEENKKSAGSRQAYAECVARRG